MMPISASLNKATYVPGEAMTLTVTTEDRHQLNDRPITVQVSVPGIGDTTLTGQINGPDVPVNATDPDRVWTKISDNGTTAVFTATA